MKKLSIYIDHYASGDEGEFADKLKNQLKGIKEDIVVRNYHDLDEPSEEEWEKKP